MVVVTTAVDSERAGCLVGFHAQSSIEPQRLTVCLSKANSTYRVALRDALRRALSRHRPVPDRAALRRQDRRRRRQVRGMVDSSGPGQAPILAEVPHCMALRRVALLDEGGDHVCVVGELTAALSNRGVSAAAPVPSRTSAGRSRRAGALLTAHRTRRVQAVALAPHLGDAEGRLARPAIQRLSHATPAYEHPLMPLVEGVCRIYFSNCAPVRPPGAGEWFARTRRRHGVPRHRPCVPRIR
jgi:flavin reductase (DIM6/NTAB) family NADH-FMN oxidoreductase RutF